MLNTKAYICDGIRTPIGRYGGGLSSVRPDDLAALVLKELTIRNPRLDTDEIDDVILGCANQAGEDNRNIARMSALLAGLPETTPGVTVNRLCASGLQAVGDAARAIRSGDASIILAGGVESMSRAPFVLSKSEKAWSRGHELFDTTIGWRFVNPHLKAIYGVDSMPETAENVANDFKISRADQDAFAAASHQKAEVNRGFISKELTSVEIREKNGVRIIESDEHIRPGTTANKLAHLKPVVTPNGTITAGNSSGINDGAAALLLASEEAAVRNGLTLRGEVVAMSAMGIAPRIMGIGPVGAVRSVLAKANWTLEDVEVLELNEAFAAQALAVTRELGIADNDPRVNPNGGAIAYGHPLGMSGARLVLTLLRQMERTGAQRGIATLCVGVGQGLALALRRV